jgi:hypothetical protein
MANNIKIVGNIVNTTTISRYSQEDIDLMSSKDLQEDFGGSGDYIEYYAYDIGGNLLNSDYNYINYKLPPTNGLTPAVSTSPNIDGNIQTTDIGIDSTLVLQTSSLYPIIEIDPVNDLQTLGYSSGEFTTKYTFFKNILSNNNDRALFIREISPDRTELRLASTTLTDTEIETVITSLIDKINSADYYVDYLLNFGDNIQILAINVALNKVSGGYEILFKLYQPLPPEIQNKTTLWVVEEKVLPYNFDINLDRLVLPLPSPKLRGPNFDILINDQGTISTTYETYSNLITSLQSLQNLSYNRIQNLLQTQSADINVDYTDFSNFVFFGSAYQRIANFYTKIKQIEDYNNYISYYTPYTSTTASLQTTINQYSSSISTTISQFDGYESYLYFESSSYSWPKSGSVKPYSLLSTGSIITQNWYNTLTGSAELFDEENYDNLEFAIPIYIKDDDNNQPFLLFLNMVGQYFDNIWIYIKSITDINLANNNLDYGISRDLVYQQLKSLGVKLYNSQAGENVANYLVGANTGSNVFNNDFTITSSYLNNIPRKDLVSELHKRIYHNLPLLLKTKGTVAGLDYLMTIFGISNQTYYTITSGSISETFFTPTGSAPTGSILNVKEFGGSLKSNLINGYNNDKVRIVSNTVTGSVLSSELSLQTFPTASNKFRDDDLHYVDISFSPQNQIDTYISGAIASNNPTWSLDDFIGDPRQQYLNSYSDLDNQRKLYFETGVSGFPGFTSSLLDYNGFIRIIEYFDNSLFKMLSDFIPERASLSTGVTINSPVLERNKVAYSIPNVVTQSVYEAEYETIGISPQYGSFYEDLQGDKKPFFTGELSGSIVDVNQYFEDNYNPYLGDWDVYNSQHTPSQSINLNSFLHSDWNILLNNVSQSVVSKYRKDYEPIIGTSSSLLLPAELQDSYLTLTSYNNSRYDGSKTTSKYYNTYSSASSTYEGDNSFGKTAAIDRNSWKIGWIKSIPSQSLNFSDKTSINLEYLIDVTNKVTELNSYNNNVCDVQNIFKSGTPTILSISDMNQNKRDGEKLIWKGGYSFSPIAYRENGEVMGFRYDEYLYSSSLAIGFVATDRNTYQYWSGPGRTPNAGFFNTPGEDYFYVNNIISATTYNGESAVADRVYSNTQWPYNNIARLSTLPAFLSNTSNNPTREINGPIYRFNIFNLNNYRTQQFTGITNNNPTGYTQGFNNEPISSSIMNNIYKIPRSGIYNIDGGVKCKISIKDIAAGWSIFKVALLVEKTNEIGYGQDNWEVVGNFPIVSEGIVPSGTNSNINYVPSNGSIRIDPPGSNTYSLTVNLRLPLPVSNVAPSYTLSAGDYIRFSFFFIDIQNAYIRSDDLRIEFSDIYWSVRNTSQSLTTYIYDAEYTSIDPIFTIGTTYQTNDTLNFSISGSEFFYSSSFIDNSPNYSSVINKMSIQPMDLIKFGKFEDPGTYHEVIKVSGNPYSVVVSDSIITGSADMSSNFAILRPKFDETSVILEGKKATGIENIDKAVLIPYDASTTLKNNVGTIIKSVNTSI